MRITSASASTRLSTALENKDDKNGLSFAQFFAQNLADCARMMPFDPTYADVNR